MKQDKQNPQDKDRHLDVPAEANRDSHINFMDLEDTEDNSSSRHKDSETTERQKQWKEGLEEGRKSRDNE